MTYQNHWKSIWECILPLGVHTTSVFHRNSNDLSESLEVNLGVHTTIGSAYYQCIQRHSNDLSESLEVNLGVHTTCVFL